MHVGPTCLSSSSTCLPQLADTPATGLYAAPMSWPPYPLVRTPAGSPSPLRCPSHSDHVAPHCFPLSATLERRPPFPRPRATAGAAAPFFAPSLVNRPSSSSCDPTVAPDKLSCRWSLSPPQRHRPGNHLLLSVVPELRFTAAASSSIPDMQEPESQPFPMEHIPYGARQQHPLYHWCTTSSFVR
jgi:hypothetical protein